MKRVLFGILWFVVFYLALLVLTTFVLALVVSRGLPAGASAQQGVDAVNSFTAAHPELMRKLCWAVFLAALLAAVMGAYKRLLPGTKKKI